MLSIIQLFGGPLLALVKAAAATRWAETLSAAGQAAVAGFWMATEDHDWLEVARATVLTAEGPLTLALGDDPAPLAPVGLRTVGPRVAAALDELALRFPAAWFRAWVEGLSEWWRPEARFGEAFARTHVALLGARALLFLDSMLPELKAAQRPHLAALVERRVEHTRALEHREAELVRRGLPLQVTPQPGASPLFLVRDGQRRRVRDTRQGNPGLHVVGGRARLVRECHGGREAAGGDADGCRTARAAARRSGHGRLPRMATFSSITDHTAHHRGALTVYARLQGIVPPMPYGDM